MDFFQANIRVRGEHVPVVLRSQRLAMICLIVAWLAGTCFFESLSWGGESSVHSEETSGSFATSSMASILDQWRELETEIALAGSGIDSLVRIDENDQIRIALTQMIRNEQAILAMLESTKSLRKAPKHIDVDPDAVVVDPIIGSMLIAKGDVTSAYRKLDASRETLLLTERSHNRRAWDDAQMSAMPGLIRLVAADVDDLMSPVYVRQVPVDRPQESSSEHIHPERSGPSTRNVAIVDTPTTAGEPDEGLPPAKVLRRRPNVLMVAEPVSERQDSQDTRSDEPPAEEFLPIEKKVIEPIVAADTAPENETTEMETRSAGEPVIIQPPAPVLTVDVEPVLTVDVEPVLTVDVEPVLTVNVEPVETVNVEDVKADDGASQIVRDPIARVAAKWPFAMESTGSKESVSLNVSDVDVRTVFEMLARGYQMNILVSPDVVGSISANIEGLSAEDTLRGVLKMCNLKSREEDGLIYVYPGDGLPNESREVRLFPLDFARADVLDPAVQGLLSPIGNAYVTQMDAEDNRRTNETIVVVDTPESIHRIEEYILQADRPPRQVMIEAHVLEVTLDDDLMHGVNLEAIVRGDITVGSFGLADPIASGSNPLIFAEIDGSRIDALLNFIETTTDSKTLASPRVMVVNGQNSRIQVGQQLGFTVATVTETATIQDIKFLDTGVVLDVTPTISRDNQVLLRVKPEVSDGQINPDTLLPEEDTREVQTSVLLGNHQGVVIGGLIQETDRVIIRKLPWLGDVRHVGKLFQRRELKRTRSEIIVALVPHIIECGPATERDVVDFQRATSPLLHGPLQRACRPWEARLPDTVGQERHLDVNRVNSAFGH